MISYEPKKTNRFIVEFPSTTIQEWCIQKVNFPKYSFKDGWADINMILVDPIGPSTSQAIYQDIILPHQKTFKNPTTIFIKMLDPTGETVSKWEIKGKYDEIDFGEGDYSKDELATIKIIFKVKDCILNY